MQQATHHRLRKPHIRKVSGRGLVAASLLGAFFSFLFGAWIAPFVWAVIVWLVHRIPFWQQDLPFPGFWDFFWHLHLPLGLIWTGYYVATYLWALTTRSGRQRVAWSAVFAREEREEYGLDGRQHEWSFHPTYAYLTKPARHPISTAWPGEQKYQLVEKCYDTYRQALKRYDPPPVELVTPTAFKYQKGGKMRWDTEEMVLILPEEYLTPQRIHELLPWLAHFLAYLHLEDLKPQDLEVDPIVIPSSPDYVPLAPLLIPTGNFLWLPVLVNCLRGAPDLEYPEVRQTSRVHEADAFAVLLGQGPALERQLRRMEEELKQRNEVDTSVPPLVERIGHLEVLNAQERAQMRKLGLSPKEPPLVTGPQLGQRKQRKAP